MGIEDERQPGANSPGSEKKDAVLLALEVAGAKELDGEELRQWMILLERVLGRPESLSALTEAAGDAMGWVIPSGLKLAAFWAAGIVLIYNLMVRDLLILLLRLENTPPPAITPDLVQQFIGGLFGF